MFDEGLCVRADWLRAEAFYVRAVEAGSPAAGYRLAAGFAAPAAGPDTAAALWWAHRKAVPRPQACRVPGYTLAMAPEAFVGVLQGWAPDRLKDCNYAIGVVSLMMSNVHYPSFGHQQLPPGTASVRFVPASGSFQVEVREGERMLQAAQWTADASTPGEYGDLMSFIRRLSLPAVKRYTKPPAIDPGWVTEFELVFILK
jgi:hypothetical protein